MSLPNDGPDGNSTIEVPAGVSEIGGFGVGYLVGLLVLVCTVALALRGTAAVRPNARLAGLTLAGALLALLVAATATLDDPGQRNFFYPPEDGFHIEYGRGLVMAFAACVLFAAALRLAPVAPPGAFGPADEDRPADGPAPGPWRRRRDRDPVEDGLPAPSDLTVTPAAPFARPEHPDSPIDRVDHRLGRTAATARRADGGGTRAGLAPDSPGSHGCDPFREVRLLPAVTPGHSFPGHGRCDGGGRRRNDDPPGTAQVDRDRPRRDAGPQR